LLYRPRLCELKTWSNFDGYGFEMCINDENHVKYVGKIEPSSPAEAAGRSLAVVYYLRRPQRAASIGIAE